jgi:cobalt/nickel transport system permease protein
MSGRHLHGASTEAVAAGDSPVHRLDARVKIAGLLGLVIVSVSTPPGAWPAFAAYGAILVALVVAARLPARFVLTRMTVEVPFLAAAAILPFTAPDGGTLAGTVASKATIGVLATVVLSATTPFPLLLRGFEALRAPRPVVLIVALLWRYLHVLGHELTRMRIARDARCYRGRWLWQAGSAGALLATLFIRSLERGERVHLAMLSRGYDGGVPLPAGDRLVMRTADVAFAVLLAAAVATVRVALP